MQISATQTALDAIARCGRERNGTLTITIGTGCCESTAPFLYEDFWPGPDQEVIGEVGGVSVYAPEYVRRLYPEDDGMVIDLVVEPAESLSIETEHGVRLVLRGHGVDVGKDDQCDVATPVAAQATGSDVRERVVPTGRVQELPPHLQGVRLR